MILPWAGQYLWAKKEKCCGCVRGVLTGASQNGRSRSCLLYFYFDFVFHLTGKKVFFRALPKQITPWLQRLQRVLLDVSLASFPGQFDRKYKTTKTLQSALAMVGSASGSLCPASPRAAHNLREGWSRAAWYFRFSTKSLFWTTHFGLDATLLTSHFIMKPALQGQQSSEGGGLKHQDWMWLPSMIHNCHDPWSMIAIYNCNPCSLNDSVTTICQPWVTMSLNHHQYPSWYAISLLNISVILHNWNMPWSCFQLFPKNSLPGKFNPENSLLQAFQVAVDHHHIV